MRRIVVVVLNWICNEVAILLPASANISFKFVSADLTATVVHRYQMGTAQDDYTLDFRHLQTFGQRSVHPCILVNALAHGSTRSVRKEEAGLIDEIGPYPLCFPIGSNL